MNKTALPKQWQTTMRAITAAAFAFVGACAADLLICGQVLLGDAHAEEQPVTGGQTSESEAELAKKLQNPVANLISVPIQNNWDFGIGPKDSERYLLNVQPVIPISLGDNYNLILRTIVPFVSAQAPVDGATDVTGLGDVLQSFFFSPKEPVGGWIIGVGPVLAYPTASEDELGSDSWGAGPTAVFLRQGGGWTVGVLGNHVWSYAGDSDRDDVSSTFLQPFLSYTTKTFTTFTLNTESTYDWEQSEWTVPINLAVAQLLKAGGQPFQLQAGIRDYAERPDGGPDWGLRFAITFLFPK